MSKKNGKGNGNAADGNMDIGNEKRGKEAEKDERDDRAPHMRLYDDYYRKENIYSGKQKYGETVDGKKSEQGAERGGNRLSSAKSVK